MRLKKQKMLNSLLDERRMRDGRRKKEKEKTLISCENVRIKNLPGLATLLESGMKNKKKKIPEG